MNYPAVEIPKLAWQGIDIETGHAMTSTRLMVKQSFYSGCLLFLLVFSYGIEYIGDDNCLTESHCGPKNTPSVPGFPCPRSSSCGFR